ncbi:MAG: serine hydrolase [Lewinellaceae bacterium]|nr:serine hydrolase [Lewinellaceae bacterium]
MRLLFCLIFFTGLLFSCSGGKKTAQQTGDPLHVILSGLKSEAVGREVLGRKNRYELQVIYTQIDRDAKGRPLFKSFTYQLDSNRYFYPASMVKMPLALLSLEKINNLRRSGYPSLSRNTAYRIDSLRPFQRTFHVDPTAPGGVPSIAHDIREVFTVSDNLAYNRMFEFLGRDYINRNLQEKGYSRTGIVHRFNYPGRDNRYASPISFYDASGTIFREKERFENHVWENPQTHTAKGRAYRDTSGKLVRRPFDMKAKNWFALGDMEKMLRAIMFPETVPEDRRFLLTAEDYTFLWHYMGIFPRECDFPKYDSVYYDGYVKFFLFGDSKKQQNGTVRVFNKVGEAYGTLTDVAYIVDFDHKVEFILAATLLCNPDGVFNDDKYDYDQTGFPFLADLGRRVYEYELKRERKVRPDLEKLKAALR